MVSYIAINQACDPKRIIVQPYNCSKHSVHTHYNKVNINVQLYNTNYIYVCMYSSSYVHDNTKIVRCIIKSKN